MAVASSTEKSFDFASKRKAAKKSLASFVVDGESFDIRPVKDSSVAYLVRRVNSGESDQVITAVLDFMEAALTSESAKRFEKLALDPERGLELDEIVEVFEHVLEVVSGDVPPTSASASSRSRRTTGTASRAKPRATA